MLGPNNVWVFIDVQNIRKEISVCVVYISLCLKKSRLISHQRGPITLDKASPLLTVSFPIDGRGAH